MKPGDKFVKVEIIAYFEIGGRKVEKRESADNPDSDGIYLDGKLILPDVLFYESIDKGDYCTMKKLPAKMQLELSSMETTEEIVTRAQIWKEEPGARERDEMVEKAAKKKSKKKK